LLPFCLSPPPASLLALPLLFRPPYRPPPSTPFPYTTLFRSDESRAEDHPALVIDDEFRLPAVPIGVQCGSGDRSQVDVDGGTIADRKSTRLNSSHVSISYAVFCLKKKRPLRRSRLLASVT